MHEQPCGHCVQARERAESAEMAKTILVDLMEKARERAVNAETANAQLRDQLRYAIEEAKRWEDDARSNRRMLEELCDGFNLVMGPLLKQ